MSILVQTHLGAFRVPYTAQTPKKLLDDLMVCANNNFKGDLQETETGRFIPDDEVLVDHRRYHLTLWW
jgi:hypothetical protein